ncbi:ATP-binding protein [Streptomyces millisiae]|uniref:ATP-binding protein n=1 Tax=Streptomyces millisiae TaxID=3075542 RepID=A0ABU2LL84_9ACTN|nr:ATP-binding protein [Streptomyces sp. DSM 44918]MDT0318347.1 ATP-binding protein [Streptomyces sp. DSM 44918]
MHEHTWSHEACASTRFRLRAERESAAVARRLTRRWLGDVAVVDDAALVVTELVANAVTHTGSRYVVCRLAVCEDEVWLAVEDEGGTSAVPRPGVPDDEAECGRGLLLVEAVSVDWGVAPLEPEGRVVWAALKHPG